MYEVTIINKLTKEENIIFGYSSADAFRRCRLNEADWIVVSMDYAD